MARNNDERKSAEMKTDIVVRNSVAAIDSLSPGFILKSYNEIHFCCN
jgi:hypothetical protein